MLLKLTVGKTALMIENEMFRGLRTEVTIYAFSQTGLRKSGPCGAV